MPGTHRHTGRSIDTRAHIDQSIADILTTPIGSRVERRDYGSRLPDLVDAPMNAETIGLMRAASAEALLRWEPRIQLRRVQVASAEPGGVHLVVGYAWDGQTLETAVAL